MRTSDPAGTERRMTLRKSQIYLLSCCSAVVSANSYYAQPLLAYWARSFHVTESSAGQVFFLSMLGQALGIIMLVPLGDKFLRKKLVLWSIAITTVTVALAAFSINLAMLKACMLVSGFFSIAPQLIIPMAVDLSSPKERTRIVGVITSGILSGVVFARLAGGSLTAWLSWREVYEISAVLLAVSFVSVYRYIPESTSGFTGSYGDILRSGWKLLRRFSGVRVAMLVGGTGFVVSRMFWATLSFLLAATPFNLSTDIIGVIGLVTLAGSASAPLAASLSKRFSFETVIVIGIATLVVSFILLFLFSASLVMIIAGGLLMEGGRQLFQVPMQSHAINLAPEARSRLNMLYISGCFLGAALGAALGLVAWYLDKWQGVCYAAFLILTIQIVTFVLTRQRSGPSSGRAGTTLPHQPAP